VTIPQMKHFFDCGGAGPGGGAWKGDGKNPLAANWDGLGHYGMTVLKEAHPRNATYFYEAVTSRAIYLKGVRGLDHSLDHDASLYCHMADPQEFATAGYTRTDLMRRRYHCYTIPPLDEWFGVGRLPATAPSKRQIAAAYWDQKAEMARDGVFLNCNLPAEELPRQGGGGELPTHRVAIHLRLGDVLQALKGGKWNGPSLEGSEWRFRTRLKEVTAGIQRTFSLVSELASLRETHRLHVLVATDSEIPDVLKLLEKHGTPTASVRPLTAHGIPRTVVMVSGAPLELDFLADGNPLVALHCMASANVLLRLGSSAFSDLAALLSHGHAPKHMSQASTTTLTAEKLAEWARERANPGGQ
jgi:hypothetical protein